MWNGTEQERERRICRSLSYIIRGLFYRFNRLSRSFCLRRFFLHNPVDMVGLGKLVNDHRVDLL